MEYQTVLSVLGIGIANLVALWRMNRDLKQDLKNDINNLRQDTRNDINNLRQDTRNDVNDLRQDMKDLQQRLSRVEAHLQHLTEPQHAS